MAFSLYEHLYQLDKIGQEHNNTRAYGTSGYAASSAYVVSQIPADAFSISRQVFNHTYHETRAISVTGPEGEDVEVYSLMYNPGTPLPGGITAELVALPVDDDRGSGCFADQWAGVAVTDRLVLVKRGVCGIPDKIRLAKDHGAAGVILVHNTPLTPNVGTLSASNIGKLVPLGLIPLSVGESWFARLQDGEELTVTLLVDALFEERESWNILAETVEGDAENVIMLGAHLDSVPVGPGLNDDGSGVVAQIEIARQLAHFHSYPHKIRLAFWGAEEQGLVGSLFYTSNLSPAEADAIRFYFNYDMIGSPVPVYGIYVGENPADKVGAQLLLDYLTAKGKPAYFGGFGTGSDYVGFLNLGIASSGVQTGGGDPADLCYHLACDTLGNVNLDPLTNNTRAAAVAAATLALSVEGLPGRMRSSMNPGRRDAVRDQFAMWRVSALEAEMGHTCSHGEGDE